MKSFFLLTVFIFTVFFETASFGFPTFEEKNNIQKEEESSRNSEDIRARQDDGQFAERRATMNEVAETDTAAPVSQDGQKSISLEDFKTKIQYSNDDLFLKIDCSDNQNGPKLKIFRKAQQADISDSNQLLISYLNDALLAEGRGPVKSLMPDLEAFSGPITVGMIKNVLNQSQSSLGAPKVLQKKKSVAAIYLDATNAKETSKKRVDEITALRAKETQQLTQDANVRNKINEKHKRIAEIEKEQKELEARRKKGGLSKQEDESIKARQEVLAAEYQSLEEKQQVQLESRQVTRVSDEIVPADQAQTKKEESMDSSTTTGCDDMEKRVVEIAVPIKETVEEKSEIFEPLPSSLQSRSNDSLQSVKSLHNNTFETVLDSTLGQSESFTFHNGFHSEADEGDVSRENSKNFSYQDLSNVMHPLDAEEKNDDDPLKGVKKDESQVVNDFLLESTLPQPEVIKILEQRLEADRIELESVQNKIPSGGEITSLQAGLNALEEKIRLTKKALEQLKYEVQGGLGATFAELAAFNIELANRYGAIAQNSFANKVEPAYAVNSRSMLQEGSKCSDLLDSVTAKIVADKSRVAGYWMRVCKESCSAFKNYLEAADNFLNEKKETASRLKNAAEAFNQSAAFAEEIAEAAERFFESNTSRYDDSNLWNDFDHGVISKGQFLAAWSQLGSAYENQLDKQTLRNLDDVRNALRTCKRYANKCDCEIYAQGFTSLWNLVLEGHSESGDWNQDAFSALKNGSSFLTHNFNFNSVERSEYFIANELKNLALHKMDVLEFFKEGARNHLESKRSKGEYNAALAFLLYKTLFATAEISRKKNKYEGSFNSATEKKETESSDCWQKALRCADSIAQQWGGLLRDLRDPTKLLQELGQSCSNEDCKFSLEEKKTSLKNFVTAKKNIEEAVQPMAASMNWYEDAAISFTKAFDIIQQKINTDHEKSRECWIQAAQRAKALADTEPKLDREREKINYYKNAAQYFSNAAQNKGSSEHWRKAAIHSEELAHLGFSKMGEKINSALLQKSIDCLRELAQYFDRFNRKTSKESLLASLTRKTRREKFLAAVEKYGIRFSEIWDRLARPDSLKNGQERGVASIETAFLSGKNVLEVAKKYFDLGELSVASGLSFNKRSETAELAASITDHCMEIARYWRKRGQAIFYDAASKGAEASDEKNAHTTLTDSVNLIERMLAHQACLIQASQLRSKIQKSEENYIKMGGIEPDLSKIADFPQESFENRQEQIKEIRKVQVAMGLSRKPLAAHTKSQWKK